MMPGLRLPSEWQIEKRYDGPKHWGIPDRFQPLFPADGTPGTFVDVPVATAEDDGDDLKSVLGLSDLSSAAEGEDNPLSCVSAGSGDDDGSDTVQFVGKNTGRGGGSGGTSSGGCGRRMRELEWNRVEAINRGRRAAGAIRAAAASNPRAGGRGQQDGADTRTAKTAYREESPPSESEAEFDDMEADITGREPSRDAMNSSSSRKVATVYKLRDDDEALPGSTRRESARRGSRAMTIASDAAEGHGSQAGGSGVGGADGAAGENARGKSSGASRMEQELVREVVCLDSTQPSGGTVSRHTGYFGGEETEVEHESVSGDSGWDSVRDAGESEDSDHGGDDDGGGGGSDSDFANDRRSPANKKCRRQASGREGGRASGANISDNLTIPSSSRGGMDKNSAPPGQRHQHQHHHHHHRPGSVARAGGRSRGAAGPTTGIKKRSSSSAGGGSSGSGGGSSGKQKVRKHVQAYADDNGWIKRVDGSGGGSNSASRSSAFRGFEAAVAKNKERKLVQSRLPFSPVAAGGKRRGSGGGGSNRGDDGGCGSDSSIEMLAPSTLV